MILSVLIGLTTYGQECSYLKNEVDEFTGAKKILTTSEVFLTHTDSILKKYYRNRDYTTINTSVGNIGGIKVIYFSIKLLTKDAYKYYGSINSGDDCIFKTTEGMITLKISKSDFGDTNYDRDYTTYSTYFIITDEEIKQLQDVKIEKIRFYWGKGYNDYDVVNKDLLSSQLRCIK